MRRVSMSALRAHTRGGPEQLEVEDLPLPEPHHDEVLVEVRAAGITFAELGWDETWTRDGRSRLPIIPAHEFSGVVSKVGVGVSDFHVGDDVLGTVPFDQDGAAASFVRVPTTHIARKPRGLPHITAAALPLAGMTAWQALVGHGRLERGERVLVHGAAGSVGTIAVQLARALGADVSATARSTDHDFVRGLGAQGVIDLADFDRLAGIYDIVIDTIGGSTAERSVATLRSGGRLICLTGPAPDHDRTDVTATFFVVTPQPSVLAELADLACRGELVAPVAAIFPLERGREAYESGATRPRAPGKTVISVHGSHL
ncbi:NADP-dependent oxidoreductase [soil metagenome]